MSEENGKFAYKTRLMLYFISTWDNRKIFNSELEDL